MKLHELRRFSHSGDSYPDTQLIRRRSLLHGPHESKELQMMLDGVKPAALVTHLEPFEPYIKQGKLIAKEVVGRGFSPGHKYTSYVIGLPGEEKRLAMIEKLLIPEWEAIDKKLPHTYDARLGRLLGYTKEQVRAFISKSHMPS